MWDAVHILSARAVSCSAPTTMYTSILCDRPRGARFVPLGRLASIVGSATPNELLYWAKWPKHPDNKALDKSGVYPKSSKVADAVIEAHSLSARRAPAYCASKIDRCSQLATTRLAARSASALLSRPTSCRCSSRA